MKIKKETDMARIRYMNKEMKKIYNLSQYPNFSATGNVTGMKEKYYGKAKYCKSFGYVAEGEPVVMVSESLTVQIALNLRNFVNAYGIGQGPEWTISFQKAE